MSRWWPASVRHGAAFAAALACGVVFSLGALGVRAFVEARLSTGAAKATWAQVERLAPTLAAGRTAPEDSGLNGDAMFVAVDDGGKAVVTSDSIIRLHPQWTLPPPAPAGAPGNWQTTTEVTLRSVEHSHWREFRTYTALGRIATGTSGQRLTVYQFVLPWDALNAVELLDESMEIFVPLAAFIAAVVAWFALRRTLRSVDAIRSELAGVNGSRLDRRVPVPPSRDEISQLAVTTNETLERLQRAHDQQERFVADASHELRSPLASLRTGLEVALEHPDRADWPTVARQSLLDVQRLQRITADLLQLAVEDKQAPPDLVDLAEVVTEQVAERSSLECGPTVRSVVDGPAMVRGELVQLERLLRNLLDNAVRHAASTVTVSLTGGREVVLTVLDDGPGIPVDDRERVFDRFVRLDDARARDVGGSGLGLTLARGIAVRHGGSLCVENSDTGARLVARLPGAFPGPELP
ncbi:cell wall metabolism sensor histidine kinase WalK [Kutzneria buriramensis]|uniref:histidine kinase n=1 Tax=Kutzneria buriramensis TaxID=1045776 RepID=A0A3E0GZV7_9PSEU|nr:ATP-binding protein [Kutzneria buriramensis]REH33095.1 signal transduction histidine kinase [Kutzneria buriramensis]